MVTRRQMLKILGGIPLIGLPFFRSFSNESVIDAEMTTEFSTPNLFDELGVEPVINAQGTMTYLSGSLMRPEVMHAINSTSHEYAVLEEVQGKISKHIAKLLGCEAAMITAGAASAIQVGTAAAITGTDQEKIKQLPFLSGSQPEVIKQRGHKYEYDQQIRGAGAKVVYVEGPHEMEKAINENTVMAEFFNAASDSKTSISREEFIAVAKRNNIPTFNDAAADVPPVGHLFKYQEMGFDMVTFSGGKMLRGPQSAGLLLGRKDLIEAAKLNFEPRGSICRSNKVNKEEMFAMYVAVRSYLKMDHNKVWQQWLNRIRYIKNVVETVPGVTGKKIINPGPANAFPGLIVEWDQSQVNITPDEATQALRKGTPRIFISGKGWNGSKDNLRFEVETLKSSQVDIVAQRVKGILQAHVV